MKHTILVIFYIISQQLYAQGIEGFVRDDKGFPLEGAYIFTKSDNDITNEIGHFALKNVAVGEEVTASFLGYEEVTITNDGSKKLNFSLKSKKFEINQVNVVAQGNVLSNVAKIDLQTKPVSSSQQLMRRVPGLFIAQHAGGGKAEQMFLRGFDIDHGTDISIQVDGMPVNMVSHAHGQGYADLHFVIPETIKKIDFGKGPYNTDKGNFATAGYVEFATIDKPNQSFFNLELGEFNTYRSSGILKLTKDENTKNVAYLASEYLFSDGPFVSPQNLNRFNLMGKYTHFSDNNDKFTMQFSTFSSSWNASGQIPQRLIDSGLLSRFGSVDDKEGGATSRMNAMTSYTKKLNDASLLQTNAYFSRYDFELYSNFTFFLEDPINGDQIRQKEKRDVYGLNSKLKSETEIFGMNLKTDVGIGLRFDKIANNELSSTLNRVTTLSRKAYGDLSEINQFTYANADLVIDKLTLSAGIRGDYFGFDYLDKLIVNNVESKKSIFLISPKLSAFYQASENVQIYAKSGKGFHSNDARVIVKSNYDSSPGIIKDILPAAYGFDLGTNTKLGKNTIFNVALWYLHLAQEFVYVGDGAVVEPSGETRRLGFDVGLRKQFFNNLFFDTDINYTLARSVEGEKGQNFIPLAPDFTSTGGLTYNKSKGVSAGINYRYIKNRPANEDNSITAKGYFVTDAVVSYIFKKATISFIAENIFNTKWNEAQFATLTRLQGEATAVNELHFTPGSPLNLRASVSYKF